MKKTVIAVLLVAGVAGGGVVAGWYATRPTPGVTLESFQRLRVLMTMEEVESVLGRPGAFCGPSGACQLFSWEQGGCSIDIRFLKGVAMDGAFHDGKGGAVLISERPLIERLRHWLDL